MPSKHDPADCLADIIENADRIARYTADASQGDMADDGMMRDAVERCLERICEAAHRLGPDAVILMPGQPWSDIRGMGNRLRHAYDRISLDVLWNAVRHNVPGLADDARRTAARLAGGGGSSDELSNHRS